MGKYGIEVENIVGSCSSLGGRARSELTFSSIWSIVCFKIQKYLQSNEEGKISKNVEIFKI